jgi:fructose-specific phosphotransferase system IIC component
MKKMLRAVALAVPFVFAAGLASADGPMQLTDSQLDGVTAGADAFAFAHALAFGKATAATHTYTETGAVADLEGVIASQLSIAVPTAVGAYSLSEAAGL